MGYAQEVLDKLLDRGGRRARIKRFVDEVRCAYCLGTGVDCNSKWGTLCDCPVCGVAGKVAVKPPW